MQAFQHAEQEMSRMAIGQGWAAMLVQLLEGGSSSVERQTCL